MQKRRKYRFRLVYHVILGDGAAIFGVNIKYMFPFICGMIGSCLAAVVSVSSNVMANSIGVGGIPGILSIQPQYMLMFAVCMLIAIVVPFVLYLYRRQEETQP